jgi:hypothetical protein
MIREKISDVFLQCVTGRLRNAGLQIVEIIERKPYAPKVEYQSRRAYIFAQKPRATIT